MKRQPCQSITRKTLLYKTKVEYENYTINHIEGCAHGCLYPCYAMMLAKRFGKVKSYAEWIKPKIVSNAIDLLEDELEKRKTRISNIHLCFTTDPFMYGYKDIADLSLRLIKLINSKGVSCSVLTKGILPQKLADFSSNNSYGITLISLDEDFRKKMEPFSAPYKRRIAALRLLSEKGMKTWVSIEPYPTPNICEQSIIELLSEIDFSDRIIFGRMNYNKKVSEYKNYKDFFNSTTETVIRFCKERKIDYYIKQGTFTKT